MKTKSRKKENCNGRNNTTNSSLCNNCGNGVKNGNHLITEYFPTLSRTRRVTAKALAAEQEKLITYYVANQCDPIDSFYVVDIKGKGKGVISATQIPKGHFVCEYAGDLIKKSEAQEREKMYELEGKGCYMYYFTWGGIHWCVDATEPSSRIGRLINHSRKSPNCKTRLFIHCNKPHLIFTALRDIQPKEEILYDYGENDKTAIEAHPWLNTT